MADRVAEPETPFDAAAWLAELNRAYRAWVDSVSVWASAKRFGSEAAPALELVVRWNRRRALEIRARIEAESGRMDDGWAEVAEAVLLESGQVERDWTHTQFLFARQARNHRFRTRPRRPVAREQRRRGWGRSARGRSRLRTRARSPSRPRPRRSRSRGAR